MWDAGAPLPSGACSVPSGKKGNLVGLIVIPHVEVAPPTVPSRQEVLLWHSSFLLPGVWAPQALHHLIEYHPRGRQQHDSRIYTPADLVPASNIEPPALSPFVVRGIRRGVATKGSGTNSVEKMVDIATDNHICVQQ